MLNKALTDFEFTCTSVCTALEQVVLPSGGAGLWTPSHALTRPLSKMIGSRSWQSGVEVIHWSPSCLVPPHWASAAGQALGWEWPSHSSNLCTENTDNQKRLLVTPAGW